VGLVAGHGAEVGFDLPDDVARPVVNDGVDGSSTTSTRNQRALHLLAANADARMLDECGSEDDAGHSDRPCAEIGAHRHIVAYEETSQCCRAPLRGIALAICSNWDWISAKPWISRVTDAVDVMVSSAGWAHASPTADVDAVLERVGVAPGTPVRR